MALLSSHLVVLKIAARNVFLHRMRTLVVGAILTFGALLAVVGHSLVDGVSGGMENSTTQSITGDLQIYSDKAKDKLSVFGNMDGTPTDVGHIDSFETVATALKQNPNVAAIVPMGTNFAQINPGNILDQFLEKLRKSYRDGGVPRAELESQTKRVRFLLQEIRRNLAGKFDEVGILTAEDAKSAEQNLERATSDEFWRDFAAQAEAKIEFLANKIAPLIFDDGFIYFAYVGTDPQLFKEKFPQFEVVKGEMIPSGTRGLLLHDYFYENMVKHRVARRLDLIKRKMRDDKLTITASKELQDQVKANAEQAAEIYLQLGPNETEQVAAKMRTLLKSEEKDFRALLKSFLAMSDADFQTRYDFFYKEIAPHLILYRVQIGEVMPLSAFTKSGGSTAVNVKIFGTFRFKSFENSPLAGNFSLIDLVSLRELYGFMTEERRAQNAELAAEMSIADVDRDSVEALFSREGREKLQKVAAKPAAKAPVVLAFKKNTMAAGYTQDELNQGVFMHAAVFLKNSAKREQTIKEINELAKAKSLGIQAVSWRDAAGFIGQMTFMMKAVLNLFIGIALLLAALMITNSLLMAAMNRTQEIGTMRAIGAPVSFIYRLFFYETVFISLLFGGIGALLGSIVVIMIGRVGIPANGDVATFFFSGPRLFLHLDPSTIIVVITVTVVIAVLATQYPAWKAMKISPLQAMQKRE